MVCAADSLPETEVPKTLPPLLELLTNIFYFLEVIFILVIIKAEREEEISLTCLLIPQLLELLEQLKKPGAGALAGSPTHAAETQ